MNPCGSSDVSETDADSWPKKFYWSIAIESLKAYNFLIYTEYGEILHMSPYAVRMEENKDQNNSEYGRFLRSGNYRKTIHYYVLYVRAFE